MQPARRDGLRVMRRNFPSLLILPLVVAVAVGVPLVWAFPSGLTFWRSVGIVLGWLGGGLLLASLLLMLREPRLAASFGGLERMYRWHHRLGVCAYVAFLAHPLALALDGWQERPALAWSVLAPAQESWPVWCGWAFGNRAGWPAPSATACCCWQAARWRWRLNATARRAHR